MGQAIGRIHARIQAALTWNGRGSLFGNAARIIRHSLKFPHPFPRAVHRRRSVPGASARPCRACWACIMNSPHGFRYEKLVQDHAYNSRRSATRCRRRSSRAEPSMPASRTWPCAARFAWRCCQAGPSDAPGGRRTGLERIGPRACISSTWRTRVSNGVQALFRIPDETMTLARQGRLGHSDTLWPNANYVLPERWPTPWARDGRSRRNSSSSFPGVSGMISERFHVRNALTASAIGNGAGFWGDNLDAPIRLAEKGGPDFLTLEYLAELTSPSWPSAAAQPGSRLR